ARKPSLFRTKGDHVMSKSNRNAQLTRHVRRQRRSAGGHGPRAAQTASPADRSREGASRPEGARDTAGAPHARQAAEARYYRYRARRPERRVEAKCVRDRRIHVAGAVRVIAERMSTQPPVQKARAGIVRLKAKRAAGSK